MPKLSVVIPVYNEASTIRQILEKVNSVPIDKEIIVVDNASYDGTTQILKEVHLDNLRIIRHDINRGKGDAVISGLAAAGGDFVVIQDADLEYDPSDFLKLIQKQKETNADLVLGARFTQRYHGSFIPQIGNRFLTALLNFLFHQNINDSLSCYKLFHPQTIRKLGLQSYGFEIEVEIIAKAIINRLKIAEVPISYSPRSYSGGKKIRWRDGLRLIASIIKYKLYQIKNAK